MIIIRDCRQFMRYVVWQLLLSSSASNILNGFICAIDLIKYKILYFLLKADFGIMLYCSMERLFFTLPVLFDLLGVYPIVHDIILQ